jgi:acyl-CoA synthetase (AMP-forming)/AMP-acid ligase II
LRQVSATGRKIGRDSLTADGWFETGDVATIVELGYMRITHHTKGVIEAGGERISSIELKNLAVGHPGCRGSQGYRGSSCEAGRAAAADRGAEAGAPSREAERPAPHHAAHREMVAAG